MDDIIIRLLPGLPVETMGVTVTDPDGNYNIYLNPIYDQETLKKTVDHELSHIRRGDLHREGSVDKMESDADETAKRLW